MFRASTTLSVTRVLVALALASAATSAEKERGAPPKVAEQQQESGDPSLRDLLGVEIRSASRKLEPMSTVSTAIYVITREDIRRMGALTIPEALRVVPGLHVARIDGSKWSVSSRGFAGQFANKLLVMIDGRAIYTPLFSGVYWDAHDVVMEDIDRIEVIRGPGAALWGANAVNGVINVITRSAEDSEGFLASAAAGNQEGYGAFRYGGKGGDQWSYRVSARYSNRANQVARDGAESLDSWDMVTGGFRLDWQGDDDRVSFLGSTYRGNLDTGLSRATLEPPFFEIALSENETSGVNVLSRWSHGFSVGNELTVQAYYDRYQRNEPDFFIETRDTFDGELQHGFVAGRHDVVWGGRYRFTTDDLPSTGPVRWTSQSRDDQLFSVFAQDRVSFAGDRLRITFGSKFEHNDYSGFELQPNARVAWIREDHTLWGSVSRAVRTPARFEHTFELNAAVVPTPQGALGFVFIEGNPRSTAEEVIDYELGYRVQPTESFSVDLTGFYNDYDHLTSIEPAAPPELVLAPFPHLELRQTLDNLARGTGYGTEIAVNLLPTESWRLSTSYSYLKLDVRVRDGSADGNASNTAGSFPQNQFRLQSFYDISDRFELDGWLHYVDELPTQETPSYMRVDLRFGWNVTTAVELSVIGQNLFDEQHLEYGNVSTPATPSLVPRSVLVQFRWKND